MKRKDKNKPVGKLKIIDDFLPPPDELLSENKVKKITIMLDEETIDFFKVAAENSEHKYQRMIREVLKHYALRYRNLYE